MLVQQERRLRISLPPPHAKQAEIEACTAKRIVIPAGRRAGKTTMAARKAISVAKVDKRALYTAPITAQTDRFWELCTNWLGDAIYAGIIHENKTKRVLSFPGEGYDHERGKIVARTAFRPDHLRGDFADWMCNDEYAYQDPEVWEKVAQPMLLDNDGDAWFISSPDKRNHFYLMFLKALADTTGRWRVFPFTSHDNPHLSVAALAELTDDMLPDDYRQEIMAEFVKGYGQVFRLHMEDFVDGKAFEDIAFIHAGHRVVAGLDWGRKHDPTAISIGCATCREELELEKIPQTSYPEQRDWLRGIYKRYLEKEFELELRAESNAMGLPVIEQLREDGIPVLEFFTSASSKPTLVQQLRLTFEQRSWQWLNDSDALLELETYESKVSKSGNISFNAPEGLHDDTVVARMLMLYQSIMGTFTLA